MRPSVKYGVIGGLITVAILFSQYLFQQHAVGIASSFKYMVQLVVVISIIASIKQTKDQQTPKGELLELKTGMRAGASTSIILCLFLGFSFLVLQMLIKPDEILKKSDEAITEFFTQHPIKDTSSIAVSYMQDSFQIYYKQNNYAFSKYYLEKINIVKPHNEFYTKYIGEVNNKMVEQLSSFSYQIKQTWPIMFVQLIIGLVISFITTMIFRFKQQSEL